MGGFYARNEIGGAKVDFTQYLQAWDTFRSAKTEAALGCHPNGRRVLAKRSGFLLYYAMSKLGGLGL